MGIERSREELQNADLVLLVLDRSERLQPLDRQLIATTQGALLIANKSDLPPAWAAADVNPGDLELLTVSAERGDGIDSLVAAIALKLVPDLPIPGAAVPFRGAQVEALSKARGALLAGEWAVAVLRAQCHDRRIIQDDRAARLAIGSVSSRVFPGICVRQRPSSAGGCGIRLTSGPVSASGL